MGEDEAGKTIKMQKVNLNMKDKNIKKIVKEGDVVRDLGSGAG